MTPGDLRGSGSVVVGEFASWPSASSPNPPGSESKYGTLIKAMAVTALLLTSGCLSSRIGSAIHLRDSLDAPDGLYTTRCVEVPHPSPLWCQRAYKALGALKTAIVEAEAALKGPGSRSPQSKALKVSVKEVNDAFHGH